VTPQLLAGPLRLATDARESARVATCPSIHALVAVGALVATFAAGSGVARAEEPEGHVAGHRMAGDLDGTYLTAGPVAGALATQDTWNSAVGAELSLVRLREGRFPALLGVSVGGVVFDRLPGLRSWAELELGIDRFPVKFGVSAGLAAQFDRVVPPHLGAQATLWVFAGIVPYVRIGVLDELGGYFEAGLMIKIPVKVRY
jgi:hypothetical protein